MSIDPVVEYNEILARVRSWPREQQLHLAEDLFRSLPIVRGPDGLRGVPAEKMLGAGLGSGPIPDEETIRRWIDEHRMEKYG